MPRLIVLHDTFRREREEHALHTGARVCDELMRLFPDGFKGEWRLFAGEACADNQLTPADMKRRVMDDDTFSLICAPAGWAIVGKILVQFAIAALLGAVAKLLTPRTKRPNQNKAAEDRESGTNQMAGQSNLLRPGARVPEHLGTMRVYPDLIAFPLEWWTWPNSQTFEQWYVMGMGCYDATDYKLGDTPLSAVEATSSKPYPAETESVPAIPAAIPAVRQSVTVDNLSLDATISSTDVPANNIQFVAATRKMISPDQLSLVVGQPINIQGTQYNGSTPPGHDFFILSGPDPSQTVGPYEYVLDGTVFDEPNTQPLLRRYEPFGGDSFTTSDADGVWLTVWGQISFGPPILYNPSPGALTDALYMAQLTRGATKYRGRVTEAWYRYDEPTTNVMATDLGMPLNLYGAVVFPSPGWTYQTTPLQLWKLPISASAAVLAAPVAPLWTAWQAAPLDNLTGDDALLIDIAFPQGLVKYHDGVPTNFTVNVEAEFRRIGTTTPTVVKPLTTFTAQRTTYLRHTDEFKMNALGLAGSGRIEVRLRRVTAIPANTANDQFTTETRWASFRALKRLAPRTYKDLSLFKLFMLNTRSAASLGETSFNCVATRVLQTWDGSTWLPSAATDKWAPNFIARLKANDGGGLSDDLIDLAGIKALQDQLDAMDGGQQGRISLTLDQNSDIDTELAIIADVIRAQCYRVGRKIYVTRDQANPQRIALFNGRTKSSEGESVAMRLKSSDENDAVIINWIDRGSGWKQREYTYAGPTAPPGYIPANPLRVGTNCANWEQTYRRALFEWNKLQFRREQITVPVTEDGRICRPGDIVNITDDIANLALCAGEVIYVSALVLTLDHDVAWDSGANMIVLRDVNGVLVDNIPITQVAGSVNKVNLTRAPGFAIKPRDEAMGTLYAVYAGGDARVRQWQLTSVEIQGPYVELQGVNYSADVYAGDTAPMIGIPPLNGEALLTAPPRELPPRTVPQDAAA